ncbi:MAG: disulfide bond formation protein B [Alphaproteobacteria bacterium]|nr:MAG: disulfide bond formation protein B [Alphaproteobacteria bacterium]
MEKYRNPITLLICFFWRNPLALAFLMSLSLLLGAYGFQYLGGMEPCDLCWTQRYAHMAILLLSGAGLLIKNATSVMAWATVIALDVSVAAAGYHTGVEQKWWRGPDTCTSAGIDQNADMESLFDSMMDVSPVLCDEIPWQMFGISMAGYNLLISGAVAGFVTFALLNRLRKNHVKTR